MGAFVVREVKDGRQGEPAITRERKPIKAKSNGYLLLSVHGHAHLTHLVLVVSTLLSSG